MRVSVVVPVRDRRGLLREAVASALLRIGEDDEILVADDGSADGVEHDFVDSGSRVRFLALPAGGTRGASAARNRAVAAARGEFLAFLDSDDVWLPRGLDAQVAVLAADPGLGLSHARAVPVGASGAPLPGGWDRAGLSGDALRALLRKNPVVTSTVVVPAALFRELGGFDESLSRSMDRDLWIRIAERRRFHFLDEEVALYRFHPGQQIADRRAVDAARRRIYEKALERYRIERPELVRFVMRLLKRRLRRLARLHERAGDLAAARECREAARRYRRVLFFFGS